MDKKPNPKVFLGKMTSFLDDRQRLEVLRRAIKYIRWLQNLIRVLKQQERHDTYDDDEVFYQNEEAITKL